MKTIHEKHWNEQRLCSHDRRVWAVLQTSGAPQIRRTCADCGYRVPGAAPRGKHPNADDYPVIKKFDATNGVPRKSQRLVETSGYDEYLASDAWKSKRVYYLGRAMHRCQICYLAGGPGGRGLQVHHRTYERLGAELDADVTVLCADCHERHHGHIAEHAA